MPVGGVDRWPIQMSTLSLPRTLILSDLHLGRPGGARRAAAFETLLADFDRVIVNGDIAELHHAAYQADAELELAIFRDICTTRGIKLDLIAGNHDPFVSNVRALTLADGAIYVTHGDAFHPAVAPWSPYAAHMRKAYDDALSASRGLQADDEAHFRAAREASLAEWKVMGEGAHVSTIGSMAMHPGRVLTVLRYWSRYPAMAAEWVERYAPQAGTVIVGHSHRAFYRAIGGRHVVNTGSYGFPGRPHAVVIEGATVRMHALSTRGHYYALASDAKAAWPITIHARAQLHPESPRATASQPTAGAASTPAMNRAASASAVRSSETA